MSSGHKCSYFNCGKIGKYDKDVRYHVFPADVMYSRIWLLNSGNSKLYSLSPEQLRKRYLCSNHFIDSMFMNAAVKQRLIPRAVPIKCTAQSIEQLDESRFGEIHMPVTMCTTSKGNVLNDEENELNSTSFERLKVLTPKKKYNREPNILNHRHAALSMFSSTLTVSPETQNYISDQPELPTSSMHSSTLSVTPDTQNYNFDLLELQTTSMYSSTLTVSPDTQNDISDQRELPTSSMHTSTLSVTPDTQNYHFDLSELQTTSMYSSTLTVSPDTQNYISDQRELPTSSMHSSTLSVTPDTQNYNFDLPELPTSSMHSSTLSVTPDTQNYISDLPELPTLSKNFNFTPINYVPLSLQLKNEHLKDKRKKLEKLLSKKKATIINLINKNSKLLNKKIK